MRGFLTLPLPKTLLRLIERLTGATPEVTSTVDLDYCAEQAEKIPNHSKLAYVLMNAYTFEEKSKYKRIRQELLETGKIEAVIYTPSRLFEGTGIPVSIIVISENNSESVMLVNASKLFHEESRAKATLTDDDIEKIVNACYTETDFSKRISISEITENDYSLSPPRYILPDLKNPVEFGTLIKSYRCGLQLSPEQREALTSDIELDWQFAQPKNIINHNRRRGYSPFPRKAV